LSISSHLLPIENSKLVKPVRLPPGRPRFATRPAPTGEGRGRTVDQDDVGRHANKLPRVAAQPVAVVRSPSILGAQVAPLHPSQIAQPFIECADAQLRIWIAGGKAHEHWQIRGLLAVENAPSVDAAQTIYVRSIASIAHQTTGGGELSKLVDRWNIVARRAARHG
jgi:hypothetical protein